MFATPGVMFANIPGASMNDVDLVRNLLLGSIGDEDDRYRAYDTLWLPMERAQAVVLYM